MVNIGLNYYFFGSADSQDIDVMVDHPEATGTPADKDLVTAIKAAYPEIGDWNINIIRIQDGIVTKSIPSKGSPDSVNNSLFHTYELHTQQQTYPFPLNKKVERNLPLATVKCVRAVLTLFKNAVDDRVYKEKVRPVLRSGNWEERIDLLSELVYFQPFCADEKDSINLFKSIAFYLGQTIALFDGTEIYDKTALKTHFPELAPVINREPSVVGDLLHEKLILLQSLIRNAGITQKAKHVIQCGDETIDFKNEINL
jgi:hypothetical protein